MKSTYYRWRQHGSAMIADILGDDTSVIVHEEDGTLSANVPSRPLSPDEARMIGVRLIEAAAYAGRTDAVLDQP